MPAADSACADGTTCAYAGGVLPTPAVQRPPDPPPSNLASMSEDAASGASTPDVAAALRSLGPSCAAFPTFWSSGGADVRCPHRLRSIEDHLKRLDLKFEQQQDGATTPPVRSREASDWREAVA